MTHPNDATWSEADRQILRDHIFGSRDTDDIDDTAPSLHVPREGSNPPVTNSGEQEIREWVNTIFGNDPNV